MRTFIWKGHSFLLLCNHNILCRYHDSYSLDLTILSLGHGVHFMIRENIITRVLRFVKSSHERKSQLTEFVSFYKYTRMTYTKSQEYDISPAILYLERVLLKGPWHHDQNFELKTNKKSRHNNFIFQWWLKNCIKTSKSNTGLFVAVYQRACLHIFFHISFATSWIWSYTFWQQLWHKGLYRKSIGLLYLATTLKNISLWHIS